MHHHHPIGRWFYRGGQDFIGRHRGGHGFGRFGGGFMDDGDADSRSFRMGRKLTSAGLQLLVLALLAEKPRHGYEVIKALEERSNGFYSPSPGMVYPALTYLEEIEYATVTADGARKLYQITEAGRSHLAANREAADSMFAQFGRAGEKMERVRRLFSGEAEADGAEAEVFGFGRRGFGDLHRAWHELKAATKAALHEAPDRAVPERQRIAEILRRAAAEIRGEPTRDS